MSTHGDFKNKQRAYEIEHEGEDLESDYFGEFICWLIACVVVMAVAFFGILGWNHLANRWREPAPVRMVQGRAVPEAGLTLLGVKAYPCPEDASVACSSTTAVENWNATH